MALPTTTRYESTVFLLPRKEDLERCFSIITKAESASYFAKSFEERLKKAGVLKKTEATLNIVKEFAHNILLQSGPGNSEESEGEETAIQNQADVWAGDEPRNDFQNLHFNKANEAAKALKKISEQGLLKMDMARNESGFLKFYSQKGKAIGVNDGLQIDKIFNAWLVKNNMFCQNGLIYQTDAYGKFEEKADQIVPLDTLKQLIQDERKGPEHFFSERGIDLKIVQHKYPEARKEAEKAPVVEKVEKVEAPAPAEPEITPEEGPTPGRAG
jgi:hypothetical protein